MKYTITIGEKKNLGNYETLHVEVVEEFESEKTSRDVAYDIVAGKLDYFVVKRLLEIKERKANEQAIKQQNIDKALKEIKDDK